MQFMKLLKFALFPLIIGSSPISSYSDDSLMFTKNPFKESLHIIKLPMLIMHEIGHATAAIVLAKKSSKEFPFIKFFNFYKTGFTGWPPDYTWTKTTLALATIAGPAFGAAVPFALALFIAKKMKPSIIKTVLVCFIMGGGIWHLIQNLVIPNECGSSDGELLRKIWNNDPDLLKRFGITT
jgi:hypothetical protein